LVFTGSAAVFEKPQPSMIGYALAKIATHSIAMNMVTSLPKSRVVTILPNTLDTPGNWAAMPDSDFSKWEKVD